MRVIIAGSRDFNSYNRLETELNQILGDAIYGIDFEIVSGGARGADRLGEKYARQVGAKIKQFIPDWQGLGRREGIVRNEVMAKYATHLVAFWDGISPCPLGVATALAEDRDIIGKIDSILGRS